MSGTYKFGDKAEGIRILQQALADNGFNPGPVDSVFGPATLNAVNDARAAYKLDGINRVDADLLRCLGILPKPRKDTTMETVLANVKSAWLSKLNWTLAAGALFNLFAFFGLQVPSDVKDAILAVGNGVVIIAAWVIRTWFTTSVTAAAAKKL